MTRVRLSLRKETESGCNADDEVDDDVDDDDADVALEDVSTKSGEYVDEAKAVLSVSERK